MGERMTQGFQWFDQRTLRERIVLSVCTLIVLLFLANLMVLAPHERARKTAQKQLVQLGVELADLSAREAAIEARRTYDPDSENREKVAQLQAEIERKHKLLQSRIVTLVTPQKMPELLRELLTQEQRLQLLHLANQQPERVQLAGAGVETEAEAVPSLYRHRLQLEFSGSYLATLDYLRKLEALPQAITWDSVEIETDDYPNAKVRLQVHTLSLSEAWIGG
jgi:MSHA biogenesis protein MshJ